MYINIDGLQDNLGSYTIFDDSDWVHAVREICIALNKNDNPSFNLYNPKYYFTASWPIMPKQIDKILTAYIDTINECDDLHEFTDEGEQKDSTAQSKLIEITSLKSAQPEDLVHRALKQLYWFTDSGEIRTTAILKPRLIRGRI